MEAASPAVSTTSTTVTTTSVVTPASESAATAASTPNGSAVLDTPVRSVLPPVSSFVPYYLSAKSTAKSKGGSIAEWLACWTQAQKGPGSNRSRDAAG